MSETQHTGKWTVYDAERDNERTFDSRSEAEAAVEAFPDVDLELIPPSEDRPAEEAEVVEVADAPEPATADEAAELPERSVGEDPLDWVPGDFIDEIDGSLAINRKGFEVLAHFYDVSVSTEIVIPPEDTDHEYCRATATASTPDGRECVAHGSAHVERGDDKVLLLEMADTRARKRALSIATGVGAVAVEELKAGVQE